MITRHAQSDTSKSHAQYSECGTYRYALTRDWDDDLPRLVYIMLNPSKATEQQNDPTIERCERRARVLGYGGFRACNLFALRETDPHAMRQHPAPEGPENRDALRAAIAWADDILCAWGVHGAHQGQGPRIEAWLRGQDVALMCFGLTKDGHPKHPLYLPYRMSPQIWPPAR